MISRFRVQEVSELSLNLDTGAILGALAPAVPCWPLCPPRDQRLDQAWLSQEVGCAGYSLFKCFIALW